MPIMNMPLQLICIFSFIFMLLPPSLPSPTPLVAKNGCLDHCGNLSIPYPFGVGSDCYLDPSFNVSCDASTHPPKAYLTIIKKEVIEINDTYVRVKYPNYLASACYDLSNVTAAPHRHSVAIDLSGTPYTLSDQNWLTAIGCDDMVVGIEQADGSLVGNGCGSICRNRKISDTGGVVTCPDNGNWSMLGDGCCRATVSAGTTFLRAELSRALSRRRVFRCSYAFIEEMGMVNQSGYSYHLDFLNDTNRQPVVQLDWKIGSYNCTQINETASACKEKSVCFDDFYGNVGGYRCTCAQGYQGNPYLSKGCQVASSISSSSIAKPGCLDQCGDTSIPFPFGVGPRCYLDPSFNISCNHSTNPPVAYLPILNNAEIKKINGSQIWVKYPNLGVSCYNFSDPNNNTNGGSHSIDIDLSATQYTLSTDNWLTLIGCDDMVVAYTKPNRGSLGTGCVSFCSNRNDYGYSPNNYYTYDPGVGCCRAPISKGTNYLGAEMRDVSGEWQRRKLFSCSFAFVEQKSEYYNSYTLDNLNNSTAFIND